MLIVVKRCVHRSFAGPRIVRHKLNVALGYAAADTDEDRGMDLGEVAEVEHCVALASSRDHAAVVLEAVVEDVHWRCIPATFVS